MEEYHLDHNNRFGGFALTRVCVRTWLFHGLFAHETTCDVYLYTLVLSTVELGEGLRVLVSHLKRSLAYLREVLALCRSLRRPCGDRCMDVVDSNASTVLYLTRLAYPSFPWIKTPLLDEPPEPEAFFSPLARSICNLPQFRSLSSIRLASCLPFPLPMEPPTASMVMLLSWTSRQVF